MATFVQHTVKDRSTVFRCPATITEPGGGSRLCEDVWDYNLVRHVACLTDQEKQDIEKKLGELHLVGTSKAQQCPRCAYYCVRADTSEMRICCAICSQKMGKQCFFCWACLRKWKSKDMRRCGNWECSAEDPRLLYLEHADKIQMGYTGITTYGTRACPQCGFLIHCTGGCKHMRCSACRLDFCFVCLKSATGGNWRCGNYDSECTPAPLQTRLPGQFE